MDDFNGRLIYTELQFYNQFWDMKNPGHAVRFCRMNSPFYSGEKWAVRWFSSCLNSNAEWELEPIPSSRDDAFYTRCRFETLEQAVETYNRWQKSNLKGEYHEK